MAYTFGILNLVALFERMVNLTAFACTCILNKWYLPFTYIIMKINIKLQLSLNIQKIEYAMTNIRIYNNKHKLNNDDANIVRKQTI